MSFDPAVEVSNLGKCFQIYATPRDRLKQFFLPRLRRWFMPWSATNGPLYYTPFWALQGLNFQVGKGETIGIIGRNGSGKSTLLQLICGTLTPTCGNITIHGKVAALLELGAGFNPDFSGRENVFMNAALLGMSREQTLAQMDEILRFADIGPFIDQPVKTYSSGMYVRLAFAVAINVTPDILIVDEALSVGDEAFQRKCFSRIEALRERGCTILFVSHSGATVVELCDRAIFLDQGEQLMIGTAKEVVALYQKFINAPAAKIEGIRREIRALQLPDNEGLTGQASDNKRLQAPEPPTDSFYDPDLRPQSTLRYEPRGAEITSPRILTPFGTQVNILVCGETYIYSYRVRFSDAARQVRFGMLIRTISGLDLGGAASAPGFTEGIVRVNSGDEYEVRFQFRCSLTPGVYFMNAGVVGADHEEENFMDRVIDAVMFRVQPTEKTTATGVIDFQIIPELQPINACLNEHE